MPDGPRWLEDYVRIWKILVSETKEVCLVLADPFCKGIWIWEGRRLSMIQNCPRTPSGEF